MSDVSAGAAARWRGEIVALQLVVGIFFVQRLYFQFNGGLLGDEAYYWFWGQRLGWSYFDHPPLHAWLLRVVATFAPWHIFSVRLLTWFTLAGVFAIFWDWSKRLAPADPALWFWRAAAIYLAIPMVNALTMSAYHDHLLVFLSLLAVHCFLLFTEKKETGAAGATRWLYFAAIALGLAVLTKYNGLFVGLGFALTFLLRPQLRAMLRTPHPWLAALLAVAIQTPVIWWNLTADLASFRFHLDDRWGSAAGSWQWVHLYRFTLLSLLLWSPILIWPLLRLIRAKPATGFEGRARTLVLSIVVASTLSLATISIFLDAYFYWNIVAISVLAPLLVGYLGNGWIRWLHLLYGLIWGVIIVVNYSVVPIAVLLGKEDKGAAIDYDWPVIAEHMRVAATAFPTDLIASTRYSTTSQLGFALGIRDMVKLSPEHSQYDYWQAGEDFAGRSALILVDNEDKRSVDRYFREHFAKTSEVDRFSVRRLGKTIYSWRILRGEGFIPSAPAEPDK